MRFEGTHVTTYRYSAPVFLEPHKVRLRPRSDPAQVVHEFSIDIKPQPAGITEALDAWGNNVTWAWFSGQHDTLEITTRFVAERVRVNPFDFVVPTTEGTLIPPTYPSDERTALDPYFHHEETWADPRSSVRKLADEIAESSGRRVVAFASELARRIHAECRVIVRPEGAPLAAEETLLAGDGSCRDLAVLYVDACRHVGIASRFVSGYVEARPVGEPRELHAWAGVYVPGAGWRGYDPTQGLAVSTGHVTVATAASPSGAAPVTGSFRASDVVQATLTSSIELDISSSEICRVP